MIHRPPYRLLSGYNGRHVHVEVFFSFFATVFLACYSVFLVHPPTLFPFLMDETSSPDSKQKSISWGLFFPPCFKVYFFYLIFLIFWPWARIMSTLLIRRCRRCLRNYRRVLSPRDCSDAGSTLLGFPLFLRDSRVLLSFFLRWRSFSWGSAICLRTSRTNLRFRFIFHSLSLLRRAFSCLKKFPTCEYN